MLNPEHEIRYRQERVRRDFAKGFDPFLIFMLLWPILAVLGYALFGMVRSALGVLS